MSGQIRGTKRTVWVGRMTNEDVYIYLLLHASINSTKNSIIFFKFSTVIFSLTECIEPLSSLVKITGENL